MNLQIYKYYPVYPNVDNVFTLPKGSRILKVDTQRGQLCAWVLHDLDQPRNESRAIAVYGTGIRMPDHGALLYINTCFDLDGALVWHAFERVSAF